ncbi:MAG TPA: serine hydrolase [Mycobacterium sp.]|nr:serine hydrolase [Mycobacterium sp.]
MIGGDAGRPPSSVTLDNWQTAPLLAWSFQHIADLFPTATISRGSGPVADLPTHPSPLGDVRVALQDGSASVVGDIMDATDTDGWMVLHEGRVLVEEYPRGMSADARHLLMSVSKSFVGVLAGILASAGTLRLDQPLSNYVPELAATGYAGASARHLLDMRSGIAFSEDYLDPRAGVRLLEQAIGWAPRVDPDVPGTLYDFLLTLRQKSPHGGPFEYRSAETDVLGWVCEAAAGVRMPELMSQLLWARLGAEFDANIGVDSAGAGMFDGGISATLRDLARFGSMILRDGTSLTGQQVVPATWIHDTVTGAADSRDAFAAGPVDNGMPGGMYRNQFWIPYPSGAVLLSLGIHGQMIYVNRPARVVAVKLSSWPLPQDAWKLFSTLRAFDAVAAQLQ